MAKEYLQYLPKELSQTLLKNLPGDLISGYRGTSEFARVLTEAFGLESKVNAKGKTTYPEVTRIINTWGKGKEVKPEYKEFLEKPENQKTGLIRKTKDGKWEEIKWTDPLLTMLSEARENAGKKMHSIFEGVDFSSMSQASKLGAEYGKANKLMEEGKIEEAEQVIMKAFTEVDGKAKKALYHGTGS